MEKKLQHNLMRLIIATITLLLLIGIALFYTAVQSILVEHMKSNNQNFVDQVGASFEIVVEQITDQVYKLSMYENELLNAVEEQRVKKSAAKYMYDLLDSIVFSNRYLYSSYLYSPQEDCLFTSEWGSAYDRKGFYDQAVLPAIEKGVINWVEPRLISTVGLTPKLIFSVVIPIPLNTSQAGYMLVINIDAEKLYADILKKNNASEQMGLYIANQDDQILVCQDFQKLGENITNILPKQPDIKISRIPLNILLNKPMTIQSNLYSPKLGWNFYLHTEVDFDMSHLVNQYVIIVAVLALLCIGILISYGMIRYSTRPIKEAIFAYKEKIFRDILLDSGFNQDKILKQLTDINQNFGYKKYCVALFEATNSYADLSAILVKLHGSMEKVPPQVDIRIVFIRTGIASIIFNFNGYTEPDEFFSLQSAYLKSLYNQLNIRFPHQIYLTVSTIKNSLSLLPVAYQECAQLMEYKISMRNHMGWFHRQIEGIETEYPTQIQKQIINNLIVGNVDGCMLYLEKFLDFIFVDETPLTDMQIKNYIYHLQNNILKRISSLPISIKVNSETDISDIFQAGEIREKLVGFLQAILIEISKKNDKDENVLTDSIFRYIEENMTKEDFNLNNISYQFSINRNYLAKLIKEKTGQNFNEYVNLRKITAAKDLLTNTSLPIREIAEKLGFAYVHYFIKIFKELEGITPGQYRKLLEHNKNA